MGARIVHDGPGPAGGGDGGGHPIGPGSDGQGRQDLACALLGLTITWSSDLGAGHSCAAGITPFAF